MVVLCNSQQNWISPVPSPLFTLPETQRLERSQQSPQLQLRCSSSSGQQIDELPPVYKLNDDCLQEIFHWCATTNNLCQLSSVSRQWRKTALQPYVWRTIDYTWDNFVQQQQQQQQQQNPSLKNVIWDVPSCTKRRKKNNVFSTAKRVMVYNDNTNISESTSFLLHTHIRTIRISNEDKQLSTVKYLGIPPDISPFIAVRKLQLSHMNFNDIVNLVDWFPNLEELDCDKILAPQLTVSITAFEALRKLRVLILNFKSACELADGMPFNLTFITTHQQHDTSLIHQQIEQQRWKLPPQLQTLKIANIHDFDECLTPGISVVESSQMEEGMVELIQAWNRMEEILFRKYMVFTTLHNLTDLSLDNCTAFTAKVWRECIAPCTKQLVRLSLGGWAGDGSRESPLVWETQDASTQSGDMHQVELALSELFAGLSLLESLSLSQFKCAPGLVHGLEQLAQTKNEAPVISHLDATNDKLGAWNKSSPPTDIKDLLGWTLNMAEIKFGQGLPGQIQ
ncbi:hypothetical protein BC941DRAFT_54194 [Chlamydoabsidia padenii]|nr:hypothetical protein BC941DRAFT_54194 [Chlamydoabsidia padenii]